MMRRQPQDNGTSALTTTPATGGEEREIEPISGWGLLRGHDGQRSVREFGQDTGVTPYSLQDSAMGFLMTTESQDLGLTSHPKDGAV